MDEAVGVSVRIMALVHTIGLLHTHGNELVAGATAPDIIAATSSCRLFDDSATGVVTLIALGVFVVYTALEAIDLFHVPYNNMWHYVSVLLGSYLVMAIKPTSWFLSFGWTDCSSLYNTSMVGGRCATAAYVLIFGATACMLRDGLRHMRLNGDKREVEILCMRYEMTAVFEFWLVYIVVPLVVFVLCTVMMWLFLA